MVPLPPLPPVPQVCGYQGPIYMTLPTKAIMPIMLEDYHKVSCTARNPPFLLLHFSLIIPQ